MRKIIVFLIVVFGVVWVSYAEAALVFNADFAQEGTYDSSWPMKAGDVVSVDVYVSNVPAPGLISMGFKLTYDPGKLLVESAAVDEGNWPLAGVVDPSAYPSTSGELDMAGFRLTGLPGNNIRLGRMTLRCISEGTSALMLLIRGELYKGFVLDCDPEDPLCDPGDPSLILDGDIGTGVLLTTIRPPVSGDVNGDGLVNLADAIVVLKVMAQMGQGEVIHITGDVDGDGKIGLAEASYAFQKAAGLR